MLLAKRVVLGFVAALLVACATRLVLEPLPADVPPGFDVNGNWRLVANDISVNRIPAVGGLDFGTRSRPASIRDVPGSAAFVFLETGKALKITQTDSGLFISFDRAIVEEYRFGERRLVAVGPIQAQRATGFPDGVLTIQTADQDGALMTERYRRNGAMLSREINILRRDDVLYAERREYRQVEAR